MTKEQAVVQVAEAIKVARVTGSTTKGKKVAKRMQSLGWTRVVIRKIFGDALEQLDTNDGFSRE